MLKFFSCLLFLISMGAFSQTTGSNMLLLKKNNKTISRYYAGSYINFFTSDGMPVNGLIERLTPDSIYISQYSIRRLQRADGAVLFDTSAIYHSMFHLDNIGSFPRTKVQGKNILTDGTLLMIAGLGYLVLNIFNTTRQGDPPFGEENLDNVLWATGAVAVGYGLKHAWPKKYTLGKKYKLKVLPTG